MMVSQSGVGQKRLFLERATLRLFVNLEYFSYVLACNTFFISFCVICYLQPCSGQLSVTTLPVSSIRYLKYS